MRVLLVHPEDSPKRGPWSRRRWDLVVDLGRSSRYSQDAWCAQLGCPVLGADSFRQGVSDARVVRQIFSAGRGRLIDEEGIDWWDLTSLLLVPEALNLLAFQRMTAEIGNADELWSTRSGWASDAVSILLGRPLRSFTAGRFASLAARAGHYASLLRRFSPAQIKQIFLDKYDSGYQWRSRFASKQKRSAAPVVLLPSAYSNVSRMAADYARTLPQQSFLMVATRQSAKQFMQPANIEVRELAAYAPRDASTGEISSLTQRWGRLKADLCLAPEMDVLSRACVLDTMPMWLRDGVFARDAWREVLEREPVCSVLCGDDSNLFTRLPVLLAAARNIPTVDFHHGAFDGRYLFKDLPCDLYLAKNAMERDYLLRICGLPGEKVVIAPPAAMVPSRRSGEQSERERRALILFSEPYETGGIRGEEFYRELLPKLLLLARENGKTLIIKLHPFESRAQRTRLVRDVLGPVDAALVTILDGPLTADLIAQAWCGITIESTTVIECQQSGVCCFLCGWLALSPYEYAQQYTRFGVGQVLHSAEEIRDLPARLAEFHARPDSTALSAPADPLLLQRWLTSGIREPSSARSAS
jgi:hypothetical protein